MTSGLLTSTFRGSDPPRACAGSRTEEGRRTHWKFVFDSSRYEALDGSEMEVRVHLPPSISSTGEGAVLKKGIIYFHGGAFIFGNAADFE